MPRRLIRRKSSSSTSKTKRKSPTKKKYEVDGCTYDSKPIADYHVLLSALKKKKLIKSFLLPQAGETKKTKFHAYKATIDGIQFDSLNESRFYLKVLQDKKDGLVKSFELQKPFEIVPAHSRRGKRVRKAEYLADFVLHMADGKTVVIDVKGIETDVFKLKKKLVEYLYPDIEIVCCRYVAKDKCWKTLDEIKKAKKAARKAA